MVVITDSLICLLFCLPACYIETASSTNNLMTGKYSILTSELCWSGYNIRKQDGHKGTFGKVLIMAGSSAYPGAGVMASIGALRSGVGIVTLALPECLKGALPFSLSPEIILRYFPEKDGGFFLSKSQAVGLCAGYDAVLAGCGWGKGESRFECLKNIAEACDNVLVLDADALNIISEKKAWHILDECNSKTIITPHIAEFTRLLQNSYLDLDLDNRVELAEEFARKHKTIIVQKSASTVITDSRNTYVNDLFNSGLAKGGSGDLLAGLIAGISASRSCKSPLYSAMLGVYIHSQAGYIAKELLTENGMTIADVARSIPKAWKEFLGD